MGKREDLIAATARAIDPIAWEDGAWMDYDLPSQADTQAMAIRKAEAALNAILAGLKTPSDEAISAGSALGWCVNTQDRSGENGVRAVWQAMLSTLEETKP